MCRTAASLLHKSCLLQQSLSVLALLPACAYRKGSCSCCAATRSHVPLVNSLQYAMKVAVTGEGRWTSCTTKAEDTHDRTRSSNQPVLPIFSSRLDLVPHSFEFVRIGRHSLAFACNQAFRPHSFPTHGLAMAPTSLETAAASVSLGVSSVEQTAPWSKEEIFGLLGVICVVLVPCLGFALRYFIMKYWSGTRRERRLPSSIRHCSPLLYTDFAIAVKNEKILPISPGRRKKLRFKGVRNNTIVVVC